MKHKTNWSKVLKQGLQVLFHIVMAKYADDLLKQCPSKGDKYETSEDNKEVTRRHKSIEE
jgi:hypothetical protein